MTTKMYMEIIRKVAKHDGKEAALDRTQFAVMHNAISYETYKVAVKALSK